jgi:polysaccharide deacetylase 2 family uncharacterized protein YibQ
VARDPDLVETAPGAPDPVPADGDTLAPLDEAATAPGSRPAVAEDAQALDAPAPTEDTQPQVSALEAAPEAPGPGARPGTPDDAASAPTVSGAAAPPQAVPDSGALTPAPQDGAPLPARPQPDDTAPVSRDPSAPVTTPDSEPAPVIATRPTEEPKPAPEPGEVGEPDTSVSDPAKPQSIETSMPSDRTTMPAQPQDGDSKPQADVTAAAEPRADTPAVTPRAPQVAPEPEAPRAPPVVRPPPGSEATVESDDAATAPRIAALPQNDDSTTEELRPTIGQRVVPLTERNAAATVAAPDAGTADAAPLNRFAQSYENADGKPMMAIVLIDDAQSVGVEALRDFPYPVTFAVDPAAPDAAAKMARHRAAGFEVLALVNLPTNGTAQDAEVALAASFARLDEAIGVLEGTGTGIQGNRALSDQVTAFVGATGRGLITQGSGLNTVPKLAVRDGVPAAPVFRDFDGAGQTPTVMRRFLDQAAFRARQEGAVVMLGRVRPDTISALLIWGLQDRSDELSLAPASAVLRASVAGQ